MELLSKDLKKNMKLLSDILHVDENFDIIYRVITIGGKNACFYCVDGFAKDETLQRIMQYFLEFKKGYFKLLSLIPLLFMTLCDFSFFPFKAQYAK